MVIRGCIHKAHLHKKLIYVYTICGLNEKNEIG